MIPVVLLLTVLLLALVEAASRRVDIRKLSVRFSLDTKLTGPGEPVVLRYTVCNAGRLPVLYAGLSFRLDSVFSPEEDESFLREHAVSDFAGTRISFRFFLGPGRQFSGKLRFSVRRRGLHGLGNYYLEFGDFLGLKPRVLSGNINQRIICTAETCSLPSIRALGGELGNISVRRFLYDDPTMILGYREYSGREPLKQISWSQSVRAGKLIVRRHDFTTDHSAVILVNIDSSSRRLMEVCLSMTGSVCRLLEAKKIPYALFSNGDLHSLPEGLGESHLTFIERRIGLSSLTEYTGFSLLVENCIRRKKPGSTHIVLTPSLDESIRADIRHLARYTDREPVVLSAEDDALRA